MSFNDQKLAEFLHVATDAARSGGDQLLHWLGKTSAIEKGPNDLVTQADLASQNAIRNLIHKRYPEHLFLGEEDDGSLDRLESDQLCWIVDPLDGTKNFVHQLRSFSVSIALAYQRKILVGVVFDPCLEECYTAVRGKGAHLNGQQIRVSNCMSLDNSLTVCSFPGQTQPDSPEVQRFLRVLCSGSGSVRRLGSAALNLSYVACGRLDAYWASSVRIWDVAAGFLLVDEAGGLTRSIDQSELDLNNPRFISTSTIELMSEMMPLMQTG